MIDVYSTHEGTTPLLISVPHDGRHVPGEIAARMTAAGSSLPDTDWHVAELYGFARELGASMLVANYSRYVVDLNRSAGDHNLYPGQLATGLCPEQTFSGEAIYTAGGVAPPEKAERIERYWRPYHDRLSSMLDDLKSRHGYALLWDAHSIPSIVPRLFDGELPELNIGSNDGASCVKELEAVVTQVAAASPYSVVVNGRFKGGYITRHYGDPKRGVHALQLEIAQRAYMDEASTEIDHEKADTLRGTLERMLSAFSDGSALAT